MTKKRKSSKGAAASNNDTKELKRLKEENELLNEENQRIRDTLNFVEREARFRSDYYCNLVWWARSDDPLKQCPDILDRQRCNLGEEKFIKFMQDVNNLSDPRHGDWNHGFNSGCLAMSRLLLSLTSITEPRVWDTPDDGISTDSEGEPKEPFVESVDAQREDALNRFPSLDS